MMGEREGRLIPKRGEKEEKQGGLSILKGGKERRGSSNPIG